MVTNQGAARATLRTGETIFANAQQSMMVCSYLVKKGTSFDAKREGRLPRKRSPAIFLNTTGQFDSPVTKELRFAFPLTLTDMMDAELITRDRYPRFEDCAHTRATKTARSPSPLGSPPRLPTPLTRMCRLASQSRS